MEPQFEELARRISDDVTKRVVDDVAKRVADDVTKRVVDDVTRRVADDVTKRVTDDVTRRVADDVTKRVTDDVKRNFTDHVANVMEHRMNVHHERIEGLMRQLGESYGATLGSIDRRLTRLEKRWDSKLGLHDAVLMNHAGRIEQLEKDRQKTKG